MADRACERSGHMSVSLADGQCHIERATRILDGLHVPEQIVTGWAA